MQRFRPLFPLALLAIACAPPDDVFEGDELFEGDTAEVGSGLDCADLQFCRGSGAVYTSLYRVGASPLSSGELLQTFAVDANALPAAVRLTARPLRLLTGGATQTLVVELVEVTTGANPEVVGDPLATGSQVLSGVFAGEIALTGSGSLETGKQYALRISAIASDPAQTTLVGVGAWTTGGDAGGSAFRTALRRASLDAGFAASRFRPAGAQDVAFGLRLTSPCGVGPQFFSYTGATQTAVVPAGCSSFTAKVWGGGGGGSYHVSGGGGGHARATFSAEPGASFTIWVGGGGQGSTVDRGAGAGGGGSAVIGNGLVIHAGGGGGGSGTRGGGGGGESGEQGESSIGGGCGGDAYGGLPGTQSGPGAGGSGGRRTGAGGSGGNGGGLATGSAHTAGGWGHGLGGGGAYNASDYGSGGGGGGFFGGGEGGGNCGGAGGGGGSGKVPAGGFLQAGSRATPGGFADEFAGTAGVGGGAQANGSHGQVVIVWTGGPSEPAATLVTNGAGGRNWSDGSYAASCEGYRNPSGNRVYAGVTGDGVYTVKPGSTPFNVTCDMTDDGGGWTLVSNGTSAFGTEAATITLSTSNATLQAASLTPLLAASSQLLRFGRTGAKAFLVDPSPLLFIAGTPTPHVYASNATSLRCSTASPAAAQAATPFTFTGLNCQPKGVGSHTCGVSSGWILLHSGAAYNVSGAHPCPWAGTASSVWIR